MLREPHRHVNRDEGETDERQCVAPFRALRPIAEREDVTHDDQTKVHILQDEVGDVNALELERRVL